MAVRWLSGSVAALILALSATSAARADAGTDACWQLIMQALDHSAHTPRARFTTYGERATITEDGHTLENVRASITYREDGVAYVDDERWVSPFISRNLEPGPPVLGPYGGARDMWLGLDDIPITPLPVIASVHNHPNGACRDDGSQAVDGAPAHHLYIREDRHNRVGLREIWIDPKTAEIRRVVVSGPLRFYGGADGDVAETADFTIDVGHVDGYTVVEKVWWKYEESVYSQRSILDAEYDFSDFRFSEEAPPGTIPAGTATR